MAEELLRGEYLPADETPKPAVACRSREYLGPILPSLADLPVRGLAELTPTAWAARSSPTTPVQSVP